MLPTLTSLLILLSFAVLGDAAPSPIPLQTGIAADLGSLGRASIEFAPIDNSDRPRDLLCESDSDEEDDAPTDGVIAFHDRIGRAPIASSNLGILRAARFTRRPIDRSAILRC